ncbi:MAG: superoxide dismutase, partial [Bacteroidota bacterium]|nr:superoxide dismutase [Bacteroidota bacterium]
NELEPILSERTLQFHYGKHHQAYVDNLNKLIPGTKFEDMSLTDIVKTAPDGPIYNNAAQIWNHTFYFEAFCAPGSVFEKPCESITNQYVSVEDLKEEFNKSALGLFGSGWTWLAINQEGKLQIINESNAGNPLRKGLKPILCIDVWEHAYYLDYQNRRAEYLTKIWEALDWKVINKRF